MSKRVSAFIVATLVLLPAGAKAGEDAQQPPAPPRPRIGLVLAGGGARGGAHIGVLQVMEELKIPVDCVAGTSMGSIVGGLYSAGMSPGEMQDALEKVDWEQLLSSKLERKRVAFRRKEDDDLSLFPFELGVGRKGISSKGGLIGGGKIDFLLHSLTLNTAGARTFDQLRIPFRAVAADLATGDPVVIDHGNLADAMRASMSIPGVFTPVTLDGRVLIDGGIAMNLPVDVAFELCADRVIAIDVGTPPKTDVSGLGTFGVMAQMIAVMSKRNVVEQRSRIPADSLLITPDLGDVGTGDFSKIDAAIAAGVAAARQQEAELRAFAVPDTEFDAFLGRQRRGGGQLVPEATVDDIRVQVQARDGSVNPSPRLAERIKTETGKPLDTAVLYSDLVKVSQAGEYENVTFSLEPVEGRNELVIEAKEKSWGPGYVSFGLSAESDFEGDSAFSAIVDYRRPKLNRFNAESKTLIFAGDQSGISTEFYQPLGYSGFRFVPPYAGMKPAK
jgi:NTE family protein